MGFSRILGAAITAVLALSLTSCSGEGGSPAGPTAPAAPPATGTILTIVSGETDSPVSGARVTVDGATFITNSAGQLGLPQRPAEKAPIDIIATGYLDRLTVFRSDETRLSLWPRTSPTGLTELDTMCLVYTNVRWTGQPPLYEIGPIGGDSLRQRYPRAPVRVFYANGFEGADSNAIKAQTAALAALNEALGGGLTYLPPSFGPIPEGAMGELDVVLTIDPTHPACAQNFAGTGEPPPVEPAAGTLRVNNCDVCRWRPEWWPG